MNHDVGRFVVPAIAVAGGLLVAVGAWLPWLVVRPGYDGPVPMVFVSGMEHGYRALDYPILVAGVGGATGVLAFRERRLDRPRVGGYAGLAGGTVAGLVAVLYWLGTTGPEGMVMVFVLGPGFFLTVLGAGALLSAGGSALARTEAGLPGPLEAGLDGARRVLGQ